MGALRAFLLLLSVSALQPVIAAGSPSCEAGKVGALLCGDVEVVKLDADLNATWNGLSCSKQQRVDFVPEQKFWLRERNNCNNETDSRTCLVGELRRRIAFIKSLRSCDDASRSIKYGFTDAWYVLKHPDLYLNTTASIAGSVSPDSCESSATSTTGILSELQRGTSPFRVVFKSLPAEQREFLCNSNPFSHWSGVIKRDTVGLYLYLSDILGEPLP